MRIKIDYREKELYDECIKQQLINDTFHSNNTKNNNTKNNTNKITLISENLHLGDIIIYDDLENEKVIIERKTLNDLAASIRDGRYKEQSFRLNECSLHNHNIFYLIEGDIRYYKPFKAHAIDKKALLSSMVSITYFKGFSLHRTLNVTETAEWILQFALKISKEMPLLSYYEREKLINNNTNNETITMDKSQNEIINTDINHINNKDGYSKAMKRVKKENINKENIGEIMLSQIPGVSINAAIAIMKTFRTIENLIIELKNKNDVLNDIKIKDDKTGKERRINKTCISNIYDFLIYKEEEQEEQEEQEEEEEQEEQEEQEENEE